MNFSVFKERLAFILLCLLMLFSTLKLVACYDNGTSTNYNANRNGNDNSNGNVHY